MLFVDVVAVSDEVAATSARTAKVGAARRPAAAADPDGGRGRRVLAVR